MVRHILALPDGTEIRAGRGEKNAIANIKLTETVNDSTEISLGSTCAACLEATVLTTGEPLTIAPGTEMILYEDTGARKQIGVFVAETPSKPTPNTLKLVCYDRVTKLDKDLTQWLKDLDGWPYTVAQFASMICEACGLTMVDISGEPNANYSIRKFSRPAVTGRALMQWCAELCCRFVRSTPSGTIEMAWYERTNKVLTPTGQDYYISGGMSRADYKTAPIDIVQFRLADSNDGYLIPEYTSDANAYIIKGNPLLSGSTEEITDVLHNIWTQLQHFAYTPCKAAFPAGRGFRAGDIVVVTDRNGVTFETIVMTLTRTGQLDTIESTGAQRRDNTSAQTNYRETIADNEQVVKDAVNGQTQAEIFDKLTNGGQAQGVYLLDGQIYINASYLATGVIRSADGTVEIDLAKNTVTIKTDTGRLVLSSSGLYGYGNDDGSPTLVLKPGTGSSAATLLNALSSEVGLTVVAGKSNATLTLGQPGAYTDIRGKAITLAGKTVSWEENSDGTFTLKGT